MFLILIMAANMISIVPTITSKSDPKFLFHKNLFKSLALIKPVNLHRYMLRDFFGILLNLFGN